MAYPDRYLLFIEYFNKGKYMSAQTTLDEIWLDETGPDKDFFGGLIQAAVALYHLTNENPQGAKKIYTAARVMLKPYGDIHLGLSVSKLIGDFDELFRKHVKVDDPRTDYRNLLPKLEFDDACAPSPSS